jgi:hypothetical protein
VGLVGYIEVITRLLHEELAATADEGETLAWLIECSSDSCMKSLPPRLIDVRLWRGSLSDR